MRDEQWARVRGVADCGLRVGGWYSVVGLAAREVQVRVHGRVVRVPRALLELRAVPPSEWTVVRGPLNALRVPASARDGYLVCPNCRSRESLPEGRPPVQRCTRCNAAFPVPWDGPRRGTGSEGPAGAATSNVLPQDRRMTRQRSGRDRRASRERRSRPDRRIALLGWPAERRLAARRSGLEQRSGLERRAVAERRRRAPQW